MSVPNTTTFSLQDVVNEIVPETNDLVNCFDNAFESSFDPLYKGNKDNLLNFRNYRSPYIVLSYDSLTFDGLGDPCISGTINVTSNTTWTATSSKTFITLDPTSGSGNDVIDITCSSNPNPAIRTAVITVKNVSLYAVEDTCNVSQSASGGACD